MQHFSSQKDACHVKRLQVLRAANSAGTLQRPEAWSILEPMVVQQSVSAAALKAGGGCSPILAFPAHDHVGVRIVW